MRKTILLITIVVLALGVIAAAKQNQYGVADSRNVKFSEPIVVGGTLLPAGEYQVLHTMQGEEHVMVFKQLGVSKPVEVHAKCNLVKLSAKADQSQTLFTVNNQNQRVLTALVFRGDLAEHRF
jgi:hypothetical protein